MAKDVGWWIGCERMQIHKQLALLNVYNTRPVNISRRFITHCSTRGAAARMDILCQQMCKWLMWHARHQLLQLQIFAHTSIRRLKRHTMWIIIIHLSITFAKTVRLLPRDASIGISIARTMPLRDVCLSVRLSVCLPHAGILSTPLNYC